MCHQLFNLHHALSWLVVTESVLAVPLQFLWFDGIIVTISLKGVVVISKYWTWHCNFDSIVYICKYILCCRNYSVGVGEYIAYLKISFYLLSSNRQGRNSWGIGGSISPTFFQIFFVVYYIFNYHLSATLCLYLLKRNNIPTYYFLLSRWV